MTNVKSRRTSHKPKQNDIDSKRVLFFCGTLVRAVVVIKGTMNIKSSYILKSYEAAILFGDG